MTAVLMAEVPLPPAVTVTVDGVAVIEKSLVTLPPQPANLKEPMRVFQLNEPLDGMYWLVYQNVQSSVGSIDMLL